VLPHAYLCLHKLWVPQGVVCVIQCRYIVQGKVARLKSGGAILTVHGAGHLEAEGTCNRV
jgi:hypothetical protein